MEGETGSAGNSHEQRKIPLPVVVISHGPSLAAKTDCENKPRADTLIFFFPVQFLETIARETNRYGNEDRVCPVTGWDDDGSLSDGNDGEEEEGDQPKSKNVLESSQSQTLLHGTG
jgi:hypothetical protein